MEITEAQYQRIAHCLPVQRGNVRLTNRQVLNAILYVAEHGCKWRGLPAQFGKWHTVLYPHEPLGQERGLGAGLRVSATGADCAGHPGSRLVG